MKICCREELCENKGKQKRSLRKKERLRYSKKFVLNIRTNTVHEQFSLSLYWLEGTILAMKDSRWTIRVN